VHAATRPFAWPHLTEPLAPDIELKVQSYLRGLLDWQRTLQAWPTTPPSIAAMPVVTLYAGGRLCGCYGSVEGSLEERLPRAFLRAQHDPRFRSIDAGEREHLAVSVSYLAAPQPLGLREIPNTLEPGTHGLAFVGRGNESALLHPDVAVEYALDAAGMVTALAHKAKRWNAQTRSADWRADDAFYVFTTQSVVARGKSLTRAADTSGLHQAATLLESWIDADGQVAFSLDCRSGQRQAFGALHHGRVAVGLGGLRRVLPHSAALKRGLQRLQLDIDVSLAGSPVVGWPTDASEETATLALAHLAGLEVATPLQLLAANPALAHSPWVSAQVVTALGRTAPSALVTSVLECRIQEWCPWLLQACVALGATEQLDARVSELLTHVRDAAPYAGGVGAPVAELARTAATIEALRAAPAGAHKDRAVERGLAFLRRWQLSCDQHVWLHPSAHGAFPVAPNRSLAQTDTLGHALAAF
jgi:AMMECR1